MLTKSIRNIWFFANRVFRVTHYVGGTAQERPLVRHVFLHRSRERIICSQIRSWGEDACDTRGTASGILNSVHRQTHCTTQFMKTMRKGLSGFAWMNKSISQNRSWVDDASDCPGTELGIFSSRGCSVLTVLTLWGPSGQLGSPNSWSVYW